MNSGILAVFWLISVRSVPIVQRKGGFLRAISA
jgi:hypothetical protein